MTNPLQSIKTTMPKLFNPPCWPQTYSQKKDVKIPHKHISASWSLFGQLKWLSGIPRSNISFDICNISTKVNIKIQDIIELNKIVNCVKNKKNQILFASLDPNTIQLDMYNNLMGGGSQGCHIIFLTDIHNKCFLLI